ncbi:MAG: aconitate hydratase [Oscillospiraceae bacterium]|nr:aconitate hydratase [Oscillospiraceae bacterium]
MENKSMNLTEKLIAAHLVEGKMVQGEEIALRIDQTLTQDATGTMAYLEFEAMGIDRVRTERSVAYVDHNTLQSGFENADDHRYIQTVAAKHGIWYSRPGNGICHQVHLERFGIPGKTLIGSDSHTPTAGGLGMLAFGAGGLDVAVAMGGGAYWIRMPAVIRVELTGELPPFVTAKDLSLEVLRILSVRGGVGKVIEWGGPGVETLTVPERATVTNMGAELGATTSVFPSDEQTRRFLEAQGRAEDYSPLQADPDAVYERVIPINLSELEPLAACPHMPDNVVPVRTLADIAVDQVCIGSCTNSSLQDLRKAAAMLKNHVIADRVSLSVSPGSRQVLSMLSACGDLDAFLHAGARILECACGPCIGMGFSPGSAGVSLRTFNRNFEGRSGTRDAKVYLVSPETAVASALTGHITDPRSLGIELGSFPLPDHYRIDDSGIIPPAADGETVEVLRGPNIREVPIGEALPDSLRLPVALTVGDNITTDHIMPAGAKILPYRSNVPKLSQFCFEVCDPGFPERAKAYGNCAIIGGQNYGQGSSREHAALVPLYLGVRAVLAAGFARIHAANLINAGILPLTFENPADAAGIRQGDVITLQNLHQGLTDGRIRAEIESTAEEDRPVKRELMLTCAFTERQRRMLLAGGLLNLTRSSLDSEEAEA